MRSISAFLVLCSILILSGCSTVKYLVQAGKGQLELSNKAVPISEVLKDEKTPPRIRDLLAKIPDIKSFGEQNHLKATSNYTDYVKLDRPAAVWVMSACKPFAFDPVEWSFPIVGSFTYLGWFVREDADNFASKMRADGYDVDVRGARAYSTLGWFRDAVLSTMIPPGDEAFGDLVNVILHESVHATLYVKNQSYFNESVASFVADELTPKYLESRLGIKSKEYTGYLESEKRTEQVRTAFKQAYEKLNRLYSSAVPESEKLSQKTGLLMELQKQIGAKRDINNATLVQYRTYGIGREEFKRLYEACGENWERFFTILKSLKSQSFKTEQSEDLGSVLEILIHNNCR